MQWKRSSPELMARFDASLPDDPALERRKMFGYPCAFVNGNMFTGLHEERMIVRLAGAERAAIEKLGATDFTPLPGRTMKDYVVVPGAIVKDASALSRWVGKSFAHAKALPVKAAKKKAAKGATKKPARAATKQPTSKKASAPSAKRR